MIGLVLLLAGAAWLAAGLLVWRLLVAKRIKKPVIRHVFTVAFAAVWLVAPWIDEILGVEKFKQLCSEMPESEYYGPVIVGPGNFFDEQGRRKWKDRDEFVLSVWNKRNWNAIFEVKEEYEVLERWPILIAESRTLTTERGTDRLIYKWRSRYSPGGWIKRGTGWGSHAPYQCPGRGTTPEVDQWIVFNPNEPNRGEMR